MRSFPEFRTRWVEQYIQTYLFRDVKRLFPGLDEVRFRRFLEMLGGLSGRVLNYAEVARALGVSQPTARDYFDIAHGTFIWRAVLAYARDAVKRVVKHPNQAYVHGGGGTRSAGVARFRGRAPGAVRRDYQQRRHGPAI